MIDAAATITFKSHYILIVIQEEIFLRYDQNQNFIDHTIQLSKETGIQIYHETHGPAFYLQRL